MLKSVTDVSGTTLYGYDGADRLVTANPFTSGQPTSLVTTYSYDQAGRVYTRTDPQGSGAHPSTWIRCYDPVSGMITGQYVVNQAGSPACSPAPSGVMQSSVYAYDRGGNVIRDTENVTGAGSHNGTWTLSYDAADRLAAANPPTGASQTYTYDGSGNRVEVAFSDGSANVTTYDARGLPSDYTQIAAGGGQTPSKYCYDDAGNLTAEAMSSSQNCASLPAPSALTGAQREYSYDAFGRMDTASFVSTVGAVSFPDGVTYSYDALSRLAGSSAGTGSSGQTTSPVPLMAYAYQGSSTTLMQVQQAGVSTTHASTPYGPLAQKTGSVTDFLLKDLHGDVVGTAQAGSGSLDSWESYDPWGQVIAQASSVPTLGFQSQITDKATGMTKTATRFYDPSMGRFTAQDALFGDSMDANSLNQYAYAGGSPVGYGDATGMGRSGGHGDIRCLNDPYATGCPLWDGPEGNSSNPSTSSSSTYSADNGSYAPVVVPFDLLGLQEWTWSPTITSPDNKPHCDADSVMCQEGPQAYVGTPEDASSGGPFHASRRVTDSLAPPPSPPGLGDRFRAWWGRGAADRSKVTLCSFQPGDARCPDSGAEVQAATPFGVHVGLGISTKRGPILIVGPYAGTPGFSASATPPYCGNELVASGGVVVGGSTTLGGDFVKNAHLTFTTSGEGLQGNTCFGAGSG